jgi:hypothetical protein
MINNKTISLFAYSWGTHIDTTNVVINHCKDVFPFFDNIIHYTPSTSSGQEYNRFIVEDLNSLIHTDFVLIIQNDGWIINPQKWSDNFLTYDYIGAPWPWHKVVGNGGFSIRSKKFLELSSKLKYDPKHHEYPYCPEDYFMCVMNRNYFTDNGCIFPDIKTGLDFSFEHHMSEYPQHTIKDSFGFHGKHNL